MQAHHEVFSVQIHEWQVEHLVRPAHLRVTLFLLLWNPVSWQQRGQCAFCYFPGKRIGGWLSFIS